MPPSTALLQAILHTLPPVTYAVAYGSGAVPQAAAPISLPVSEQEDPPEGTTGVTTPPPASFPVTHATTATDAKVVDFLLAVDDVRGWHAANLAANSHHYAVPLRWTGPTAIAAVQQWRWGGGVYYNTLIPWAGRLPATPDGASTLATGAEATNAHSPPLTRRLIKYGVISTDALTADLTGWTSLYAAGRLHKPVVTLTPPPRGLAAALGANVAAAAAAAVLLLPSAFSASALHTTAAGLSYAGDVRSAVVAAEDPAKVDRLVAGDAARAAYGALYAPAVSALVGAGVLSPTREGGWAQATGCVASRERLLATLPRGIVAAAAAVAGVGGGAAHTRRHRLAAWMAAGGGGGSSGGGGRVGGLAGGVGGASALVGGRSAVVLAAVAAVVRSSSVGQAVKGVLTAGPATAARYALAKLRKGRGGS
ncbi:hypothetical protein MMPV_000368 [Pyropia vietnamensis]